MIIYCPDNFELLNKLRHDLIKVGYVDEKWNDELVNENYKLEHLIAWQDDKCVTFYIHNPYVENYQFSTLTTSNYSEILQTLTDKIKEN